MKLTVMMFAAALMLAGCKGGSSAEKVSDYGADPKKAESIYSYTPTTGVMAVSYTHLDVYKRQPSWRISYMPSSLVLPKRFFIPRSMR